MGEDQLLVGPQLLQPELGFCKILNAQYCVYLLTINIPQEIGENVLGLAGKELAVSHLGDGISIARLAYKRHLVLFCIFDSISHCLLHHLHPNHLKNKEPMEFCPQNFSSELPVQLYQPESGLWYPCHSRHRQGWFSSSAQRYHQPVSVRVYHFVTQGICKLLTVLYKSSAPNVFTWKKACGEILKVRPISFSWKKNLDP